MQKSSSELFLESGFTFYLNGKMLKEFRGTAETASFVLNNSITVR